MRLRSLSDLAAGLDRRAKAPGKTTNAPKDAPQAPQGTTVSRNSRRVPSQEEVLANQRAFAFIEEGMAYYRIHRERPREPDMHREYKGQRFLPPKLKPCPGRGY